MGHFEAFPGPCPPNDMLLLCSVLCGEYVPGLVSGVPGRVGLFFVFPGHFQGVKNRFGLSGKWQNSVNGPF